MCLTNRLKQKKFSKQIQFTSNNEIKTWWKFVVVVLNWICSVGYCSNFFKKRIITLWMKKQISKIEKKKTNLEQPIYKNNYKNQPLI